jgi:sugar phosphate isomerase/epimerase
VKLAINPATTMPASFEQDVEAYADAGFRAMEIWLGKVDAYLEEGHRLEQARALLDDNGLTAVGACFSALTFGGDEEQNALHALRGRLEMCQALGAPALVVLPGVAGPAGSLDSYDVAAEGLARCGELAEPYGVSLAIEFLKGSDFVGSLRTATDVARRTGRENVGVLFDTFHFYTGISKMADIARMESGELLLVHLNDCPDVPREAATDKMRVLPGDGIFPLAEMLGAIRDIGYDGYVSLEVFSDELWKRDPAEAARLGLERTTPFLESL